MSLKISGIHLRGCELFYEVSESSPLKRLKEWQRELRIKQLHGAEKLNLTLPGPKFLPSAFYDYFMRLNLHRCRKGQSGFVRIRLPKSPARSLPAIAPLPVWRARSGPGLSVEDVCSFGPHGAYHAGMGSEEYSLFWPHGLPHDLTQVMQWESSSVESWIDQKFTCSEWNQWLSLLKPGMSLTIADGKRFDSMRLSVSLDENIGPTIQISLTRGEAWLESPAMAASLLNQLGHAGGLGDILIAEVDPNGNLCIRGASRLESQQFYDPEESLVTITIRGFANIAECETSLRGMQEVLHSSWKSMRIDAQITCDTYSQRRPDLLAIGEDWKLELCGCYGAAEPLARPEIVSDTIRWPFLTSRENRGSHAGEVELRVTAVHEKSESFLEFEWTGDRVFGQRLAEDFDTELQVLDEQGEVIDRIPIPNGTWKPYEVSLSRFDDSECKRLLQIGIDRLAGEYDLSQVSESFQFYLSDSAERRACLYCQKICTVITEVPDFDERLLDGMTPEEMLIEVRQEKGLIPTDIVQEYEEDESFDGDDIHESDCPLPDASQRLELISYAERVAKMEPRLQVMLDVLRSFEDAPEEIRSSPFARIVYRIVMDGLPGLESRLLAGENADDLLREMNEGI